MLLCRQAETTVLSPCSLQCSAHCRVVFVLGLCTKFCTVSYSCKQRVNLHLPLTIGGNFCGLAMPFHLTGLFCQNCFFFFGFSCPHHLLCAGMWYFLLPLSIYDILKVGAFGILASGVTTAGQLRSVLNSFVHVSEFCMRYFCSNVLKEHYYCPRSILSSPSFFLIPYYLVTVFATFSQVCL